MHIVIADVVIADVIVIIVDVVVVASTRSDKQTMEVRSSNCY